jgi:hypothetical protein
VNGTGVQLELSDNELGLRLLSIFGEVENAGSTTRKMERYLLSRDAVFPPLL